MTTRLFLGGTFNPIHIGHLRMALAACEQCSAHGVTFVPLRQPPHKTAPVISDAHRLAMLKLAVGELNTLSVGQFEIATLELERTGPSYTVDTLAALRAQYPSDRLAWVIGQDSWANLHTWHQWQRLLEFANLVVVNRPGAADGFAPGVSAVVGQPVAACALGASGAVAFVSMPPVSVASTDIRTAVQKGQTPAYLVCEPVRQYIHSEKLYRA